MSRWHKILYVNPTEREGDTSDIYWHLEREQRDTFIYIYDCSIRTTIRSVKVHENIILPYMNLSKQLSPLFWESLRNFDLSLISKEGSDNTEENKRKRTALAHGVRSRLEEGPFCVSCVSGPLLSPSWTEPEKVWKKPKGFFVDLSVPSKET